MSAFDRLVHLELTTRCNALCPMCARTGRGAVREGLAMRELSLADIRAIFPRALLASLESIDLCGAFGDPLVASHLSPYATRASRFPPRRPASEINR